MPFQIIRNDITKMSVDAIVNTANPLPVIGAGTDSMIHEAAGPRLLEARKKIGRIDPGCSRITKAFRLKAKYVIHTVGPVWTGGDEGEDRLLRSCYDTALRLAQDNGCSSIAFPLISTGNYGFPKDRALQIAIAAFSTFLSHSDMDIYLVVFNREAFRLSEKLFHNVASYIDEHYVREKEQSVYGVLRSSRRSECCYPAQLSPVCEDSVPLDMAAESVCMSLEEMLRQEDAGFSETLLRLIDGTGKKDSEIYKKANLSKQHFSKIRNNPHYKPTKPTAIALALALELDLEATRDLIGRAGFALTNSSKFDLIIRYFIEQRNFNIVEINTVLYEFDQSLLGA